MDVLLQYKLLYLIIGLAVCIICGCIKMPIKKALTKLTNTQGEAKYSEKQIKTILTQICTIITVVLSAASVIAYYGIVEGFSDVATLLEDILITYTCSQVWYALYEGYGSASIKKAILILATKIKESKTVPSTVHDFAGVISTFLADDIHLPLTEEQQQKLLEKLKELK